MVKKNLALVMERMGRRKGKETSKIEEDPKKEVGVGKEVGIEIGVEKKYGGMKSGEIKP